MAHARDNLKTDLSEELAIVRAVIAENGEPVLTKDTLKEAAHDGVVFALGDTVMVLNPWRLPLVEEIRGTGVIERITEAGCERIYWVSGFACGRTARVLRLMSGGAR